MCARSHLKETYGQEYNLLLLLLLLLGSAALGLLSQALLFVYSGLVGKIPNTVRMWVGPTGSTICCFQCTLVKALR